MVLLWFLGGFVGLAKAAVGAHQRPDVVAEGEGGGGGGYAFRGQGVDSPPFVNGFIGPPWLERDRLSRGFGRGAWP